jgi:Sir2- and TIR-associating SLOG family/SIR2-like domain
LDIDQEHDLISVAQYYFNEHGGNRSELNRRLIHEFCQSYPVTENHRILARLPIRTFWTSNYDKLIEKSLEDTGKIPDVKYSINQLPYTKPKRDAVVYKMHGDIDHPNEAILIKDDYEKYHVGHTPFITALSGDLVSKTFLFLGFSFTDPNLDFILSRIRIHFSAGQRQHYCIFKKRGQLPSESDDQFQYAQLKQELAIKDLRRFNIQTILVNEYDDITAILETIESRFRERTVFVSGSAHEYGDWESSQAETFIQRLSQALISNSYKVVSGFGLGVGSHVITGALQQIYETQGRKLQDQLILRPFPQGHEALRQWETYRQDMIAYAGTAIFVFGNRFRDGQVELASGVEREFEIAKDKRLNLIPIGATGYMAGKLWNDVMTDFDSYYPNSDSALKDAFMSLNDKSLPLQQHIDTVIKILAMIKGR